MISSGTLGFVSLLVAHLLPQTMLVEVGVGWGSLPLCWWCNISLHLVGVTHDSAWGPGFGRGVSGSPTVSQKGTAKAAREWREETGEGVVGGCLDGVVEQIFFH